MNITDAMLDEYSDERIEVDDRPVLIDPGNSRNLTTRRMCYSF